MSYACTKSIFWINMKMWYKAFGDESPIQAAWSATQNTLRKPKAVNIQWRSLIYIGWANNIRPKWYKSFLCCFFPLDFRCQFAQHNVHKSYERVALFRYCRLWYRMQRKNRTPKLQERKKWQRRHEKGTHCLCSLCYLQSSTDQKKSHSNLYTNSKHVIECLVVHHLIGAWKWLYEDLFDAMSGPQFSRTFKNQFVLHKRVFRLSEDEQHVPFSKSYFDFRTIADQLENTSIMPT